ncbi:MAG: HAD family phosphatase [Bacteroidales bacterium]|jgi:putative hydrolase of the HAD superfamily|nr:HAD family phosphatase [Bacteroidales bacterium]
MLKNIIFDLGGPIYDIRYQNVPEAFTRLGVLQFEEEYTQAAQTEAIDLFEEGKISVEEFRNYIRSLSAVSLTDMQIDEAWNSIMIDIPEERIKYLQQIKNQYNLFLFSNTNQLNCDSFTVAMHKKFGFNIFKELFVKAYFSHELHIRKPHPEAFLKIIEEQQLNPKETLFIDDTLRHVEGARKAGLYAFHFQV